MTKTKGVEARSLERVFGLALNGDTCHSNWKGAHWPAVNDEVFWVDAESRTRSRTSKAGDPWVYATNRGENKVKVGAVDDSAR